MNQLRNYKAFGYEASSKYCKIAVVPDVQNLQFGFEVIFFILLFIIRNELNYYSHSGGWCHRQIDLFKFPLKDFDSLNFLVLSNLTS